eukprot:GEMP01049575.1.p1 GENE.GEMP01049575.1~~GEMP01049575.1.p1  ORF type:complete len:463 (+),score=95.17 GEMP01049575.1:166-1554(+)
MRLTPAVRDALPDRGHAILLGNAGVAVQRAIAESAHDVTLLRAMVPDGIEVLGSIGCSPDATKSIAYGPFCTRHRPTWEVADAPAVVYVRAELTLVNEPDIDWTKLHFRVPASNDIIFIMDSAPDEVVKGDGVVDVECYLAPKPKNEIRFESPDHTYSLACCIAASASSWKTVADTITRRFKAQLLSQRHYGVFVPPCLEFPLICPLDMSFAERSTVHRVFGLPTRPLLRPLCLQPIPTKRLISPHRECVRPHWMPRGNIVGVENDYEYCHYMQSFDGSDIDDKGWGCMYRSLQGVVSFFRMNYYTAKALPRLLDIQKVLKEKDYAHSDLQVGAKTWIGTQESALFINEYLGSNFVCKTIHCPSIDDLKDQTNEFVRHFTTHGTPILAGVGRWAYSIYAICEMDGEAAYLVVDPHYIGAEDIKVILSKGWVGWKNAEFFQKNAQGGSFNFVLPMLPVNEDAL